MKKRSEIFHIIAVILIAWLGGTLYFNAAPQDPLKVFIQYLASIIFIIWPLIVLFYSVRKNKPEDKDKLLIKAYRLLFKQRFLLYTSNMVLAFGLVSLLIFAVWYRPVEFKTHHEGKVRIFYDKDLTSDDPEMGVIDANNPLTLRLRAGSYEIYYKSTTGNELLKNEQTVNVAPLFQHPGGNTFFLDYDEENISNK